MKKTILSETIRRTIGLMLLMPSFVFAQNEKDWMCFTVANTSQIPSSIINAVALIEDKPSGDFTIILGTPEGAKMLGDGEAYAIPGLEDKYIHKVLIDSKEKIWFCTDNEGLIMVNPGNTNTHYTTGEDKLANLLVTDIVEGETGEFYIANGNVVLHLDKNNKFSRLEPSSDPTLHVISLVYDTTSKSLYVGSEEGVYRIKGENTECIEDSKQYGAIHQLLYHKGKLWVASEHGLLCWDGTTWKPVSPDLTIMSIALTTKDEIAAGADGELFLYDLEGNLIKKLSEAEGIPQVPLLAMVAGKEEGHFYVGTKKAGLIYKKGEFWESIMPDGLISDDIRSFCLSDETENTSMWIGTSAGISICTVIDGQGGDTDIQFKWSSFTPSNSPIPGKTARTIINDGNGNYWVAFFEGGVARYNASTKTWTAYTKAAGTFPSEMTSSIFLSSHGKLIATTFEDGYAVFENEKWQVYNKNNGVPSNSIFSVNDNGNKTLWFGSMQGAFSLENGVYTQYTKTSHGLPDNNVRTIAFAPNGDIYFGTNRGLAIAKGGKMDDLIQGPKNLQQAMINHIVFDDRGNAFLSCLVNGLYLYTTKGEAIKLSENYGLGASEARMSYLDGSSLTLCTEKGLYMRENIVDLIKALSTKETVAQTPRVYPNPASEKVYFGVSVKEIMLSRLSGEIIRTARNTSELPVGDLEQGTYLLSLDNKSRLLFIQR